MARTRFFLLLLLAALVALVGPQHCKVNASGLNGSTKQGPNLRHAAAIAASKYGTVPLLLHALTQARFPVTCRVWT